MALPAHEDYYSDSDFSSDVSTAVKEVARPSGKRSSRRHSSRRSSHPSNPQAPRSAQSQPQIEDEETAHSYREVLEAVREEGEVPLVPRRLRRQHRAFRMTWTAAFAISVLFCQLLGALWLKALAVSASHRTDALIQKIANAESSIDKTQRKIAVLGNDPQMGTWAAKMGYHQAAQTELDDISKPSSAPIEYSNRDVNGQAKNDQAGGVSTSNALQQQGATRTRGTRRGGR